jgi:hypothetical protein
MLVPLAGVDRQILPKLQFANPAGIEPALK